MPYVSTVPRLKTWTAIVAVSAALVFVLSPSPVSAASHTANEPMFSDEADGTNWPSYGRTYSEDHYSPLKQINDKNISELGLAWSLDLPTMISAVGAPLAVNGTLYFAVGFSFIYAVDAVSGKTLWTYDPKVTDVAGDKLRPTWGIRGLAYSKGHVFVGTQDGRLLSLDAKSGKLAWSVLTTEPGDGRFITGAPRVFNGKVIIGHGGADMAPTRGYVTAYDEVTGKQVWRFFLVPGDPAKGFENKAMEMAAKTWKGEWWKFGGGGTAWNALVYDPKYNRIYIGTGNGFPWNQDIRSPGGGDNLFLCSIVALDADTGEYVWHYQTAPGEEWDYNSVMDIELATLKIDGKPRDVLMHAPKNGFFYVIDRSTGKLVSAEPYTKVTWAERIDKDTGRPVETAEARYPKGSVMLYPSGAGGHNWQAMSFNPNTGLAYFPVMEIPGFYDNHGIDPKNWKPKSRQVLDMGLNVIVRESGEANAAVRMGGLQARDPVTQKVAWTIPLPAPINGGTATTAGNLLFEGQGDGHFVARDATTGKELWSADAQNGIVGQPITYMVNGKQYVTVIAGYAGMAASMGPYSAQFGWQYRTQQRRVLTYMLDGKATLPPRAPIQPLEFQDDPAEKVDQQRADHGLALYNQTCIICHGAGAYSGGAAPDLRASPIPLSPETFSDIVQGGALEHQGMPKFDEFTPAQVEDLRHYIRGQARKAIAKERAKQTQ